MSARQNYSPIKFARISAFNTSGGCLRFSKKEETFRVIVDNKPAKVGARNIPVIVSYYPFPHLALPGELDAFRNGRHYEFFRRINQEYSTGDNN